MVPNYMRTRQNSLHTNTFYDWRFQVRVNGIESHLVVPQKNFLLIKQKIVILFLIYPASKKSETSKTHKELQKTSK